MLEQLEPRLLLSADLNPLASDALFSAPSVQPAEFRAISETGAPQLVTSAEVAPIHRTNELVFVDTATPDYQALVDDMRATAQAEGRRLEFVLIDANSDGLAKITEALAQRSNLDAVHIVSHAHDGAVRLGAAELDFDTLLKHAGQIKGWGNALTRDGDILFYGCDLAATQNGQSLIDAIARLTGADVAASEDPTGSAAKGGDWDLEFKTGSIEADLPVSESWREVWDGILTDVTVTNNNDNANGNTSSIANLIASPGADGISLREAIIAANNTSGADRILFSIGGGGAQTIAVNALPQITDSVTIDARSQPGYTGAPLIQLQRSGGSTDGLVLSAGTSEIRGLIINSFNNGSGIVVGANARATVQGNYIGTNAPGTSAAPNGNYGILLFSGGNTIGGTSPADRNVISGNGIDGIRVEGGDGNLIQGNYIGTDATGALDVGNTRTGILLIGGANNNTVSGNVISGNNQDGIEVNNSANNVIRANYIGTNATGTAALRNNFDGIWLNNAASLNTIGGTAAGDGNLLSGNASNGIELNGAGTTGNIVLGNIVGLDFAGNLVVANGTSGIFLTSASGNTIGGTDPRARNVISGNGLDGIQGQNVDNTLIQGNYIGTDLTGTLDRGNGQNGVWFDSGSSNNTISSNVISGNTLAGIEFSGTGSGNIAQGNYIGTSATGAAPLGNSTSGVLISGTTGTTVGGAAGNIIAFNTRDGVSVTSGTGHSILGNSIYANGRLGIDLGSDGVTANDNGVLGVLLPDLDGGPNGQQNFPVLTAALVNGSTITITGTLTGGLSTFRIEFFASSAADPSGYGEGQRYLGFTNVTGLGLAGSASFTSPPLAGVAPGEVVTATATDASGNTSEFSLGVVATSVNPPVNAMPGPLVAAEDTPLPIGLSAADIDGDLLTVQLAVSNGRLDVTLAGGATISAGASGFTSPTLTLSGTQSAINATLASLRYLGNQNYSGPDALTVISTDLGGLQDSDTVAIAVNPVNDAPTATAPASYNATEQVALNLANTGLSVADADAGAAAVTVTLSVVSGTLNASSGTTGVVAAGSGTGALTFTGTVAQLNNLLTGAGGATLTYLMGLDAPPASDTLTLTIDDGGASGGGPLNASVISTINITPVNDAPIANNVFASGNEDSPSIAIVLSGSDVDGPVASFRLVGLPANGLLYTDAGLTTLAAAGIDYPAVGNALALYFVPAANWNGTTTFQFTATDTGGLSDATPATAAINVIPVNDPPIAINDSYVVSEDLALAVPAAGVLANDADVDGPALSAQLVVGPVNGLLALNPNGSFTYTPTSNFNGVDSFTYRAFDGALLSNVATVTINVTAVNDEPVANNVVASGSEDAAQIPITLTATDIEGPVASFRLLALPANGLLYIDPALTLLAAVGTNYPASASALTLYFVPAANWNGSTAFQFTATDAGSLSDSTAATATIDVMPINDAPVANSDVYSVDEDWALAVPAGAGVLVNDTDIDGPGLSAQVVIGPANGSLIFNSNGSFTYTPIANFHGTDSFTYRAFDGSALSAPATVTITVNSVNDAPSGTDRTVIAFEDTDYAFTLADFGYTDANDTPADAFAFVRITTLPTGGVLTLSGGPVFASDLVSTVDIGVGNLRFTPAANANGAAYTSFTFQVQDGGGTANGGANLDPSPKTITVAVVPVNDPPVANDDAAIVAEDSGAATIDVLANDSVAPDVGETLTIIAVTPGANGAVAIVGGTTVTYTPNTDSFGTDSFTYTIDDGNGGIATAAVSVTVTPVNDPPAANDDSATLAEDSGANTIDVLANDSLAPDIGEILTITAVTQGTNGSVAIVGGNTVTYSPNANFSGVDAFTYTVNDGNGGIATATVNVTVNPVNDPPIANTDSAITAEDTPLVIAPSTLTANDTDIDGGALIVTSVGGAVSGSVSLVGGIVTFTPAANYNGPASFTYIVSDGNGGSASATVDVAVTPVNDPPVANNDAYSVNEDSALAVPASTGLLVNDTDIDGPAVSALLVTGPANGSLILNPDGSLTYTPNPNFNGIDSFTYRASDGSTQSVTAATVTITVSPVNDAPSGTDKNVSTLEDNSYAFSVADFGYSDTNDSPGDPFVFVRITTLPTAGTLTLSGGPVSAGDLVSTTDIAVGNLRFTSAVNANGAAYASFTFQVQDGGGAANGGENLDPTPKQITIDITPVDDLPLAVDDAVATNEDTPLAGSAAGNDTASGDGGNVWTLASAAANGTATVAANGAFTYTPNANFNGTDSFTYTLTDADGDTSTAMVSISVTATNDPPTALADVAAVTEDSGPNAIDVLANDSTAPDASETLSVTAVTQGANGAVAIIGGTTVTYTPNLDFFGTDSFTYTIDDGNGGIATATVDVTVTPVNDPPVTNNDTATAGEDTPLAIAANTLTANDTDIDGGPLSVISVGSPVNGTVSLAGGNITFTPTANYTGPASFTYTVDDGAGGTATATVNVTVTPVNDPPTASDDAYGTSEDLGLVVLGPGMLANDSDVEGGPLTALLVTGPANGTLTLNPDGSFGYTPNANFFGTDSFGYVASDGGANSNIATVTITITPMPDSLLVVDTESDIADGDTTSIDALLANKGADGFISLREAILATNNTANVSGPDQIQFKIAGAGVHTIAVGSTGLGALPTITDAVILDAATQPGFAGAPIIELNGTNVGGLEDGFQLLSAASGSTVRGFIINLFSGDGLHVEADNTVIVGNYIGTNASGTAAAGNAWYGIHLLSDNNRVGGTGPSERNVVSGNGVDGIFIDNSTGNVIQGNFIGTNAAGTAGIGNAEDGIWLDNASNNLIGGTAPGAGNRISWNGWGGVALTTGGADNRIEGNVISLNAQSGVAVYAGTGHSVLGNSISANGWLGIDLGNDGVDANDWQDLDGSGPNEWQNYPVLTSAATIGATVTITGTLNSTPNSTFRIEFFGSAAADPSGHGEGETYLGFVNVTTDSLGDASFSQTLSVAVPAGAFVSATATDAAGNTSEFSQIVIANAPLNSVPSSVTTNEDTMFLFGGANQIAVTDPDGNLATVQLAVGNGTLNVNLAGGATISAGANNSAALTLSGTETQINAALATLAYTPTADCNGWDTLAVVSTDSGGLQDTDWVGIYVTPVDDVDPSAGNDSFTTPESTTLSGSVASNDSAGVDAPSTWTLETAAANGTVVMATDGTFTYTPNAGYFGPDSFTYRLTDSDGEFVTATAAISVTSTNVAPVPDNETASTLEDTPITIDVLAGDTDPDGDPLTITAVDGTAITVGNTATVANGSVTLNAGGMLTFTPSANYNGTSAFTYTVDDGNGGTGVANVTVSVSPVNDAPTAADGSVTTDSGVTYVFTLADFKYSDIDGDPLDRVTILSLPTVGMLKLGGAAVTVGQDILAADITAGRLQFVTAAGVVAVDSFDFRVHDGAMYETAAGHTMVVGVVALPPPPPPPSSPPSTPPTPTPTATPAPTPTPTSTPTPPPAVASEPPATGGGRAGASGAAGAAGTGEGGTATAIQGAVAVTSTTAVAASPTATTLSAAMSFQSRGLGADPRPAGPTGLGDQRSELPEAQIKAETQQVAVLRDTAFREELDKLRESVQAEAVVETRVAASVFAVSSGLSVGYVLWLLRGGALIASLLSSLPAWRLVDPLPVLDRLGGRSDDKDDASLEDLVEERQPPRERNEPGEHEAKEAKAMGSKTT